MNDALARLPDGLMELGLLLAAYLLALPSGLDREMKTNGAGLRTFPLVAMGACGFLVVGDSTGVCSAVECLARRCFCKGDSVSSCFWSESAQGCRNVQSKS